MPASRWSSTLSAKYRACPASSSTLARKGRSAEALVEYIADDSEARPVRPQRQQDLGLKPIGVLVFVNQDVVETAADFRRDKVFGHRMAPVQQEVVVIEDVVPLLGHDIGLEQTTKLG
jgi:hypothetical protein